jgi:hypothetical protein
MESEMNVCIKKGKWLNIEKGLIEIIMKMELNWKIDMLIMECKVVERIVV